MNPQEPTPRPSNYVEFGAERIRRFWSEARAGEGGEVLLDGRRLSTPGKRPLVLPTVAAAALVAEEWNAQGEHLETATMPATRLAYTAVDRVADAREAVADEVAAYAGSDLLCYRDGDHGELWRLEAERWDPLLDWAAEALDLRLVCAAGIVHTPQPAGSVERVRELALALDDFALTGLAAAAPLFGSAVLALALQRGRVGGEAAFGLSRLDEEFQESRWGVDAEAAERTAALRREAAALERWFRTLG